MQPQTSTQSPEFEFEELHWQEGSYFNRIYAKPRRLLWHYYITFLSDGTLRLDWFDYKVPGKYVFQIYSTLEEAKKVANEYYASAWRNIVCNMGKSR